jgi:hypothetical protein
VWCKVSPLLQNIQERLSLIPTEENVAVDEQIIPSKSRSTITVDLDRYVSTAYENTFSPRMTSSLMQPRMKMNWLSKAVVLSLPMLIIIDVDDNHDNMFFNIC